MIINASMVQKQKHIHTPTNKRQKKISCKSDLCPIRASFEVAKNAMTWLNYFLKVTRVICAA
jgi:hypothetical protein